jgi:ATP-dependent Clp protease ATP-binding subunit ClpA
MGARPMARVIQEKVKQPLADELIFGKLKNGGHVRVILKKDDEGKDVLGFEYPEGPVRPKPEVEEEEAADKKSPPKAKRGGGSSPPKPLVKA